MKTTIQFLLFTAIFLASCSSQKTYITDLEYERYTVGESNHDDKDIDDIIAPYRDQLSSKMDTKLATNTTHMAKRRPNSLLGNWFTDVLLDASEDITGRKIDFAAQNYGGLRIPSIGKGDITVGTIYELMPFDNTLVVLEANGTIVNKLIQRIAEYGGWPISKGLTFTMKEGKAIDIYIQDKPLDISRTYLFALPDYIANGGDDCFFLEKAVRHETGRLLRDVMIDHLKSKDANKPLVVDETNRIKTK
jgi:2',3'-cyclic-nucleotide 2'-phosphodiesterase (5'-nucleotidase family)